MRFGVRPGIQRAALHVVVPADIVQAHDVIGVGVRPDDRVDPIDAVGQCLEAQLRRRVHEYAGASVGDDHRGPRAAVTRVGARADVALAPIIGTPALVPVPRNSSSTVLTDQFIPADGMS